MSTFMDASGMETNALSQTQTTKVYDGGNSHVPSRHVNRSAPPLKCVKRARSLEVSHSDTVLHPITEDDNLQQPQQEQQLQQPSTSQGQSVGVSNKMGKQSLRTSRGLILHSSIEEDSNSSDDEWNEPGSQGMGTSESSLSGESFVTAIGVWKSRSLGGIMIGSSPQTTFYPHKIPSLIFPRKASWTPSTTIENSSSVQKGSPSSMRLPPFYEPSHTSILVDVEENVSKRVEKPTTASQYLSCNIHESGDSDSNEVFLSKDMTFFNPKDSSGSTRSDNPEFFPMFRHRDRPHTISEDRKRSTGCYSHSSQTSKAATDSSIGETSQTKQSCLRQRFRAGNTGSFSVRRAYPNECCDSLCTNSCNLYLSTHPTSNHHSPSHYNMSHQHQHQHHHRHHHHHHHPHEQAPFHSNHPKCLHSYPSNSYSHHSQKPCSTVAAAGIPSTPASTTAGQIHTKPDLCDLIRNLWNNKKTPVTLEDTTKDRDHLHPYHRTGMEDIGVNFLRLKGAFPSFMQLPSGDPRQKSGGGEQPSGTSLTPSSIPQNATDPNSVSYHNRIARFVPPVPARRLGVVSISTPDLNRPAFPDDSANACSAIANEASVSNNEPISSSNNPVDSNPEEGNHEGHGSGPITRPPKELLRTNSVKPTRNIGWRLGQRKQLNDKRRRISDYSLAFAVFGVICVIFEMEMTEAEVYNKSSVYSYLLKSLTMISTFILVGLIIKYHSLEIRLFTVNNCIEDWRIAMTKKRIFRLTVEILVCAIHPLPMNVPFTYTSVLESGAVVQKSVSIDIFLTIPMVFRLYLIFRVLLLHSSMFTDASSRSIGALNRVKFNIRFILKTLMTICPGRVLLVFILSWWTIGSWIMRACERVHDKKQYDNMLNSMWLVAITFLSVGYGDLVPHTYCGRAISVITGVMGSCSTALVVAVFARKLELKRAEKHVHNFMMDNKIYKQLRHAAANVLRETWLFYKYTRLVKRVNPGKIRAHQRKFLLAIHSLRKAKESQRKIKEDSSSLVDMAKTQTNIYDTVTHVHDEQGFLKQRLELMHLSMQMLQERMDSMPQILHELLHRPSPGEGPLQPVQLSTSTNVNATNTDCLPPISL